jgi:hypothetical protein
MVGAIELCGTKAIMASIELQMLGEDDDAWYVGRLGVGGNKHPAYIWRLIYMKDCLI